ncbi:hypothetical protein H5S09_02460 [Limosilactobacillus sp. STM2_1]|uniref:Uncharacterized protein n=1 Tax=Limosilactobacillus rudii TaxID=2759755 RepID=A0A7W3YM75_9LACO|nr:hypothetical protein [Limosilactobacillus rudii]MBB1096813.1 hypothetical protein [Limosilactobacillus rudii]
MLRRKIDMTDVANLRIDGVTDNFQVRWDNTLIVTAYDQEQTFILTVDGEQLILRRRLRDVLARFARENSIHSHEMHALYKLVGCRTRGYVAGHYRLVPTCGRTNDQVIYYMVHCLDNAAELVDDKRVEMLLKGKNETYHVQVDTSYRTFRRIVEAADQVAKIQLQIYEYCRYQYGKVNSRNVQERPYESDYCVIQAHQRRSEEVLLATILYIVNAAYEETFGEEISPEFAERIKRVINSF